MGNQHDVSNTEDLADISSIYQQAVKANSSIADTSFANTLQQQCGNETLTNTSPSGVAGASSAASSSPASSASGSTSPNAAGPVQIMSTAAIYGTVVMLGAVAVGGALVL